MVLRSLKRAALLVILLPLSGCIIPVEGDVRNATAADPIERAIEPGETIVVAGSVDKHDGDEAIGCVRDRLGNILPDVVVTDAVAYRAVVGEATKATEGEWVDRLTVLAADDATRA